MDVLRALSSLNLPLRGKSRLIGRTWYHPQLHEHLTSENRMKYLSNTIMEKQVRTSSNITRCQIFAEVEKAVFWTVNIDNSADIWKTDQVAMLVRYASLDYDQQRVSVKESFLQFFTLDDHTARSFTNGRYLLVYSCLE